MSPRRDRVTGRKESGSFLGLPHAVLECRNFRLLSAHAVKLLVDLGASYRGNNNGDLCMTWKLMQPRGWKSRETLDRARRELLHFGFIELTRQGGLHSPSLYALTWKPVDACKGKLDVAPTSVASGLWREAKPPMPGRERHRNGTTPNTPVVSDKPAGRVNGAQMPPITPPVSTTGVSVRTSCDLG
jgi:hypothetical protein